MFKSATLKLTGWYLAILMAISLTFSFAIYQGTSNEINNRLNRFQNNLIELQSDFDNQPPTFENFKLSEQHKAAENIANGLIWTNLGIFIFGGIASLYLARRHLYPIQKAHEAQSRFTSDASHELRTPLAVMKAEIEVALRDKNATPDELRETLQSSLEEVNELSKLSEMLLNLSRLENSKLDLGPVNLQKITREVIEEFGISPKRISIKNAKFITAHGNETAITELVRILIDNAVLYSPTDSHIKIDISKEQGMAKFEISNAGAGIPADKMSHVFDRFFRADSSRTTGERKGYGLGLALAKNIVELHNGTLKVTSTPNEITTFTFLLPVHNTFKAKTKN